MQNDNHSSTQLNSNSQSQNIDYSFITNPQSHKSPMLNFKNMSTLSRLIAIIVLVIIIWILIAIISGILSKPIFNQSDFISTLQKQQELIHIFTTDTSTTQEQASLSTINQNLVYSAALVFASDQLKTLNYLKSNGTVINPSSLNVGIIPSYDTELNNALQTNEFNQIFDQVVKTELNQYTSILKQTYSTTNGPKGRALLESEYHNAELLNQQINLSNG